MKKYVILLTFGALLTLPFSSCSDWVTSVDPLIDRIEDESLNDETQISFLIKGLRATFSTVYDRMALYSGLVSDEGIFDENVPLATYSIFNQLSQNIPLILETTGGSWNQIHQYRYYADDLIRRSGEITFSDADIEKEAKFEGYFHGGIVLYFLAAYWGLEEEVGGACLSTVDVPGDFISSSDLYDRAVEKLLVAAESSPDAYTTRVINSVIARCYLFKGDYANARTYAAAGMAEGDDPYQALHSTEARNEWWGDGGKGRTQVGMDFRFHRYIDEDPDEASRVLVYKVMGSGHSPRYPDEPTEDGKTVYYFQSKYEEREDPMDFMSWQENELMLAELDLRDGDEASALAHINKVRESHGITAKTTADFDNSVISINGMNLLAVERDKELMCQGMRLIDQRRFDLWHLPADWQATYHKGWQYLPIPDIERDANPNLPAYERTG